MRQTLHIFRKDLRMLWPFIAASLALAAFRCATLLRVPDILMIKAGTWAMLGAFGWWALAIAAIYQECPTGDREFWLTRPYSWRSVAAAKLLLLIVFINLPLLLSDLAILRAHSLPPSLRSLLTHQLAVTTLYLFPTALASVTSHIVEQVGAACAIIACVAIVSLITTTHDWSTLSTIQDWAFTTILFAAGTSAVIWQYARRRTGIVRAMLSATALVALAVIFAPPNDAAITLASSSGDARKFSTVHLCVGFFGAFPCEPPSGLSIGGWLPVEARGLPPNTSAEPALVKVVIRSDNRVIDSGWLASAPLQPSTSIAWSWGSLEGVPGVDHGLDINFAPTILTVLQNHPVDLKISAAIQLYGTPHTTKLPRYTNHGFIPKLGYCSYLADSVTCESAGAPRERTLVNHAVFSTGFGGDFALDNDPVWTWSGTSPVSNPLHASYSSSIEITTEQPLGLVRRDLQLHNVQLGAGINPRR